MSASSGPAGYERPAGNRPASCAALSGELVEAYAAGTLDPVTAWSVEAHLPACARCRALLGEQVSAARLARNRSALLARAALPEQGRAERVAARLGVPSDLWRLLAVTPSLRGPWLAGVAFVLAVTVGAAWLVGAALPAPLPGSNGRVLALLPFLLLAPALPVAGVAAAFDGRFDPSHGILAAAPVSGLRLFLARAVAVIGAALLPTVAAALALPVSARLAMLVVLPALAVSAAGLALSTVTTPLRAAVCAAGGWACLVLGCAAAQSLSGLLAASGSQLASCAVIAAAAGLLIARRRRLALT